ncbi:unnamed protein product [Durusdinium trenchii]|uniref:Fe2OG dioxygenase domain-containing protein n=1 Tax=Durusdinium trenchii TaxID=1381693 RepID=A0ABP0SDG1_9DINO
MVNSCDGVSLQPLLRMASCAAAAQLARAERIDIQRDLADLALAAAECVEHAPAGTALMQCVAQRSPGPNWWLPKSMYDEALRNASCTAASGSIPLQVEQPCTSCGEDKTEKSTVEACFLVILLAETILLRHVLHLITEVSRHQGPVLIHCNSGHHRSVLAVASCHLARWLAKREMSDEEVLPLLSGNKIYRPPPDPVVLWKRFASPHECDALLELAGGLPHLPALAAGAPQGTIRRSLSKALHWDHHPQLAAFQARMLAAAQNWTGEDRLDPSVLAIGEPMNLAAYLNPGDEYRSHCDGRCGARPSAQDRIATSIIYCQVADEGGHTTFSNGHLKIVPEQGDMLTFGYLVDGRISLEEHSACPVRRGQKWIATQWYRAAGSYATAARAAEAEFCAESEKRIDGDGRAERAVSC